jgi:hypothetical protein
MPPIYTPALGQDAPLSRGRVYSGVTFTDPLVQREVEKSAAAITGLPDELRPIFGLMDVYSGFLLRFGKDSPQMQEIHRLLLSGELRPALRLWYQRSPRDMNSGALELRQRLSELAGENFGPRAQPSRVFSVTSLVLGLLALAGRLAFEAARADLGQELGMDKPWLRVLLHGGSLLVAIAGASFAFATLIKAAPWRSRIGLSLPGFLVNGMAILWAALGT